MSPYIPTPRSNVPYLVGWLLRVLRDSIGESWGGLPDYSGYIREHPSAYFPFVLEAAKLSPTFQPYAMQIRHLTEMLGPLPLTFSREEAQRFQAGYDGAPDPSLVAAEVTTPAP